MQVLRFEDYAVDGTIKMENGCKFISEELMLIGLHRMVHLKLVPVYRRDWTQLSRACNWFYTYVIQRFDHMVGYRIRLQDSTAWERLREKSRDDGYRIRLQDSKGERLREKSREDGYRIRLQDSTGERVRGTR
jgi:hypothetical protein